MHLAQAALRRLTTFALASVLLSAPIGVARADRFPLVGSNVAPRSGTTSVNPAGGQIVSIDPTLVPCTQTVTFDDVKGGETPGTNYDGTELRAEYKGRAYTARIEDGRWLQDGEVQTSPSAAASAITQGGVNGWWFWSVKRPGDTKWVVLGELRP